MVLARESEKIHKQMKIAIIHFGKRGAGPAISFEMAKALKQEGHVIYYYASQNVENKDIVEKQQFITRFVKTYKTIREYVISVLFPKKILKVIFQIKKDNPDIIYSPMNDMWIPFIFPFLSKFRRIKTIHDVGIHEGDNSIINKWWNSTNFKDAEKFIILSKKYVPSLINRGIPKDKIIVIPHAGFDYYIKFRNNNQNHVRSDLLFFGRIDKYKGLDMLLDAMQIVIPKFPNVILNIVGNGNLTPYKSKIENLKKNIIIYNRWIHDDEVADFIEQTDFVVLPYSHATQSGVIPLAYAFSKPVIATNVGCIDEQVIDEKSGFLISNCTPLILAEKILTLLSNKRLAKEMGGFAHSYMEKHLTWKASARKLINSM